MANKTYGTNVVITSTIEVASPISCKKFQTLKAIRDRIALFDEPRILVGLGLLNGFGNTFPDPDPNAMLTKGRVVRYYNSMIPAVLFDPDTANIYLGSYTPSYSSGIATSFQWNTFGALGAGTSWLYDHSASPSKSIVAINQIVIREVVITWDIIVKDERDDPPAGLGSFDFNAILASPTTPLVIVDSTSFTESGDFSILDDATIQLIRGCSIFGEKSYVGTLTGGPLETVGTFPDNETSMYQVYGIYNPSL